MVTEDLKKSDEKFLGQTISSVIDNLILQIDDNYVIEEPPAVPRGISGTLLNGDRIYLFIQRGQLPLTFKSGDNLKLYTDLKVIGIKREHGEISTCYGEVLWQLSC